jgi:hypothetical protein
MRDVVCGMRDAGCVAHVDSASLAAVLRAAAAALAEVFSTPAAIAASSLGERLGSIVRGRASRGAVLESNDTGW